MHRKHFTHHFEQFNLILKKLVMLPFVTSEIKNNISEITFGTPKSNSLPGEILEKLAQTILDEAAKEEVKAIY
jgi:enoyl-CoA hydratase/carnithine racemase